MTKIVLITGMGRSGTKSLGTLLKHADKVDSGHERVGDRAFTIHNWYMGNDSYPRAYLKQSYESLVQNVATGDSLVDVNGHLRHSTDSFQKEFPQATVLHLVRDPRSVVPSVYLRRSDTAAQVIPKTETESLWWLGADKFDQICWNWANTTQRLLDRGFPVIQFERTLSDFEYLQAHVCDPIGTTIAKSNWQAHVAKKVNRTRGKLYRFVYAKLSGRQFNTEELRKFSEWPKANRDCLISICGDIAEQVGYDLRS